MNNEPVVIIGAGWAGLAAAVKLTQQGHKVTVLESAKQAGGRARSVKFDDMTVDNGQHILIGAYHECLNLMQVVGVDVKQNLKRLPLLLTVIDKQADLILQAPALPAPLHLLYALVTAKGLKLKDKFAAVKFGLILKKHNYEFKQDTSVAELFKLTAQTEILIRQLWEPLCLATMNTPIDSASANVFMKVFKDAFTNKTKDADMLLPRVDLSQLFPDAAVDYIEKHGGKVHLKARVEKLNIENNKLVSVTAKINDALETITTSKAIIATAPQNLNKLITTNTELEAIKKQVAQYQYEPIVTVYLHYADDVQLTLPMTGMSSTLSQWVFDRDLLCQQAGLVSVVISSSGQHMTLDDDTLAQTVHDEISTLFSNKAELLKSFVIREKRATFACTKNINAVRPKSETNIRGLTLAGDYTDTHYPATLEGAVRSGLNAANLTIKH